MARPTAVGLKYFPFDVDLLDDEALDFLRDKYGMLANDVYVCLLCLLYKKYGYYIPYETEKEKEDCVWYVYKHIRGGKYPPDIKTIATVIDACVARELFSRELYPKIITSKRAQCTFYSCTVERKSVPISQDLWLLDVNDMGKLSKKHPYYLSLCPENKSDEELNYSDDKLSKSDEKPINKTKLNITSNEVINSNSLNTRDSKPFKSEEYEIFIGKYQIIDMPMIGGKLCDMDFKKISQAYERSKWLRTNKQSRYLKFIITHYNEIITGYYEDAKNTEQPKGYWDEDLDNLGRID